MGKDETMRDNIITEWIISGNPKKYNVVDAFHELGKVDWKQSTNISEGDIVYIYVSDTIQAVRFKCRANIVNMKRPDIDDSKFDVSGEFDGTYGSYMELEMLEEFPETLFSRKILENHGFSSPQSPIRLPVQLKTYMDLIQKLRDSEEMDPDKHDGTYELVRETIRAYSEMDDLSVCDYNDLNLVYLMTVGTWKHKVLSKKKNIDSSNLPGKSKGKLKDLLDLIWKKAQNKEYTNSDGSFGMFGTGFFSFKGKTDKDSPQKFIKACVDILDIEDDDQIFDRFEKVLDKKYHGMKAASASMVLHCLKPFTFPIFNSNMGSDNLYVYLGIDLDKKTEVHTYIRNCRQVKKYRDEKFNIRNYRIFDMAAWNIGKEHSQTDINYIGVLDYLDNNRDVPYSNPEAQGVEDKEKQRLLEIKHKGQAAVAEMKKMVAICNERFGLDKCEPMSWLDGSNTKTRRYLLAQMKYGPIVFTTFHQSYGYEEFIEGIKPVISDEHSDGSGDVSYKVVPGIFKRFCETAKKSRVKMDKFDIPEDASVWKATVRTSVSEDCFKNNRVRIDWGIESKGASAFVNDMKPGDIIITTDGSRSKINGIAVITKDEAYSLDNEDDATTRDVMWLATHIDEDIKDINMNRMLHRMTVARVPVMQVSDIVSLAKKYNSDLYNTEIEQNEKPYVFIIDEINRGNISKIFGELITLIECTKREGKPEATEAVLPYSGDPFSIPKNVYILGTMNTADRSIALMDTALRRRFSFLEMMPETDILRSIGADKVGDLNVADMLDVINERIGFLYDREHTIGHAFFTDLKDDASIERLKCIFEKSVIPLLQEYFYEDYQKIQMILGDDGKENPDLKFIKDEKVIAKKIFKGNVEDIIDLPEKKYSINKEALSNIQSYIEIL
ncbi:TPA: AAA family ATPase [Streptococcus suis]